MIERKCEFIIQAQWYYLLALTAFAAAALATSFETPRTDAIFIVTIIACDVTITKNVDDEHHAQYDQEMNLHDLFFG